MSFKFSVLFITISVTEIIHLDNETKEFLQVTMQ